MYWQKYEYFDVAVVQHKTYIALVRWHKTEQFWSTYLSELADVLNDLNIARAGYVLMDIRDCNVVGENQGAVALNFAYRCFWLRGLKLVDMYNDARLQELFKVTETKNISETNKLSENTLKFSI